jgi:hypothetical protein
LWEATHDEIGLECLEEDAAVWDELVPFAMTNAFKKYITLIPCELDGGYS